MHVADAAYVFHIAALAIFVKLILENMGKKHSYFGLKLRRKKKFAVRRIS